MLHAGDVAHSRPPVDLARDAVAALEAPHADGPVPLVDLPVLELPAEPHLCVACLCDHHEALGAAVETVDGPRPGQGVGQRARTQVGRQALVQGAKAAA